MFKVRIIPTLLFKDLGLVKGVGFHNWRRVGSVMQAIKVYNMREVDELVFLDVEATRANRPPDFQLIDELADDCFMPLAVGGGVQTIDQVRRLLRVGADKVVLNTAAIQTPHLIREVATKFGSQCVVVSIDARTAGEGRYEVYTHSGGCSTGLDPMDHAKRAEELGAGEILITSIERDGTMAGYDLELTRRVSQTVSVPVIASGGCGSYEHMAAAIRIGGASAISAASIFHFTQQTPRGAKEYLRAQGIPVRL